MRLAILEDDSDQAELLCAWLEEQNHNCDVYRDGGTFIQGYAKESYDLIILDWMVPEMSGLEVLKHIRSSSNSKVPILFVTKKDNEEDVVQALQEGADDYMSKPISQRETVARITALLRRSGAIDQEQHKVIEFPPFVVDTQHRTIALNDEEVVLTQKEYELVLFLLRNAGRVISRGHLLQVVWGTNPNINTRTVDTHISRLRNKLQLKPELTGWELSSIYQHGYRLEKVD